MGKRQAEKGGSIKEKEHFPKQGKQAEALIRGANLEHVEHALSDDEAADDIDGGHGDRRSRKAPGERVGH